MFLTHGVYSAITSQKL